MMLSTLVPFQIARVTKSFITNIAFKRFLVRVNTLVDVQLTRLTKSFIAHIILIRNPQTQHQRFFFLCLQNRPRVHRAFRMWILSSPHDNYFLLLLLLLFSREVHSRMYACVLKKKKKKKKKRKR